jgi:hypothetical protein
VAKWTIRDLFQAQSVGDRYLIISSQAILPRSETLKQSQTTEAIPQSPVSIYLYQRSLIVAGG